jgi:purine-nucleoside phosphorylase
VSPTWTTDALFRETQGEVAYYSSQGIDTVDMEAAAVFSAARYRGVRAAAVFVISDLVLPVGWQRAETPSSLNECVGRLVRVLSDHDWNVSGRHD